MKKTIIISVSAIAVLAIAYFGYKWYKKNKEAKLPVSAVGGSKTLSDLLNKKPTIETVKEVNVNPGFNMNNTSVSNQTLG